MKKVCAISLVDEGGHDYLLCLEGTMEEIVSKILKNFDDETIPYTFVNNICLLDNDKEFERKLYKSLHETKLGSL